MKKNPVKILAPCFLALLALAAVFTTAVSTAAAGASALPQRWNTTQRGLILVPDEAHDSHLGCSASSLATGLYPCYLCNPWLV